jgi:hypothetical protein
MDWVREIPNAQSDWDSAEEIETEDKAKSDYDSYVAL